MKAWWQARNAREQHLLLVALGFIILAVLYFLMWQPLQENIKAARQTFINNQQLLVWLKEQQVVLQGAHARVGTAPVNKVDLLTEVDKSLHDTGLSSDKPALEQQADGTLSVHFKRVRFDDFITWLVKLNQRLGIDVAALQAARLSGAPGMVKADLKLKI